MSGLLALGCSHRTAGIDLRERLALPEGRAASLLRSLVSEEGISEAAAISTCNRTELYLVAADSVDAEATALGALSREAGIRATDLLGPLYSLRDEEAARHLFRVTAGLDSMIVGEAEIQGQVKRAYELALVEGVTGPVVNRLFRGALTAGKRARAETAIGEKGVSIPSVAVELARQHLGDLSDRKVLLIGAGETAELCARALAARGVETVFVANRRYNRAIGLAERFGGSALRINDLPTYLETADIVVSATDSPHPLIERPELEHVMQIRDSQPLLMIDLAVPRDIDPDCRELTGVSLSDVDDLQRMVERNASSRENEAAKAERILDSEFDLYREWLGAQSVTPTIAELRGRADEIVEQVLAENENRWENLSESDRDRAEILAHAIANRLLHEPTARLRSIADSETGYRDLALLREIFGLDSATEPADGESNGQAEVASLDEHRREKRA